MSKHLHSVDYRSAATTSRLRNFFIFGVIAADLLTLNSDLHAGTHQDLDVEQYLDMDLEQLLDVEIVTASKYRQKQSQIAGSVFVIDKQQIKQFGYRTFNVIDLRGCNALFSCKFI
jgi:hypothetical protein